MSQQELSRSEAEKLIWSIFAIFVRSIASVIFFQCLFVITEVAPMRSGIGNYVWLAWAGEWAAKKAGFYDK